MIGLLKSVYPPINLMKVVNLSASVGIQMDGTRRKEIQLNTLYQSSNLSLYALKKQVTVLDSEVTVHVKFHYLFTSVYLRGKNQKSQI